MVSCLTIMLSTAFALFSSKLTQNFTMQAAVWDVVVEEVTYGRVSPAYTCPETEGEMHEFVISPRGTATRGYCIIKITDNDGNTETYYTPPFKNDKTIRIQAVAGCEIKFIPKWGNPDDYGHTVTYSSSICHSFTPPPPEESVAEDGETIEAAQSTESGETQSDSSTDIFAESTPAEPSHNTSGTLNNVDESSDSANTETSSSKTEISPDSSESSKENTDNSSSESTLSSTNDGSASSTIETPAVSNSNTNGKSSSSSVSESVFVESSGNSNSAPSDASSSGDVSSTSESSTSEGGSSSGAKEASSASSEPSSFNGDSDE